MDVALVGQQVFGFAQDCAAKSSARSKWSRRSGKITLRQGRASQRQLRANMLAERPAFAAFPRLKLAAGNNLQRLGVAAGLVVKRAKFHAQIVALPDEVRDIFPVRANVSPVFRPAVSKAGRARKAGARRRDWPGTPCRKRRGLWPVACGC